jgi:sulfur dioxygenase
VLDDLSRVFTGDTLLVRTCGRTDFQGGSSSTLYHSVHDKLFRLPDSTKVFPAHDYFGHTDSSIGEEKKYNARLTKQEHEFVTLMANLNLPYPKKIDEALPANLKCGVDY